MTKLPTIPVFYATTHGQTAKIANHLASTFESLGYPSKPLLLETLSWNDLDWSEVEAVVVSASVYMGKHQRTARRFATKYRSKLSRVPSLFVSVSLAIHSQNAEEREQAQRIADGIADQTGWRPERVSCVAGALAYSRYGFFTKWLMRRIAKAEGGSTDTTQDHEYTDWPALTHIAEEFVQHAFRANQHLQGDFPSLLGGDSTERRV